MRDNLIVHNWNSDYAGLNFRRKLGENRYICKDGKSYRIIKTNPLTKKREIYESGIKTIEEARHIRDWWESVNWDWSMIE